MLVCHFSWSLWVMLLYYETFIFAIKAELRSKWRAASVLAYNSIAMKLYYANQILYYMHASIIFGFLNICILVMYTRKNIFMETPYSIFNRNQSLSYCTLQTEYLPFSLLFQDTNFFFLLRILCRGLLNMSFMYKMENFALSVDSRTCISCWWQHCHCFLSPVQGGLRLKVHYQIEHWRETLSTECFESIRWTKMKLSYMYT